MTNNTQQQVFKGGWEELENTVFTDNKTTFDNFPTTYTISPDGSLVFIINTNDDTVETFALSRPYDYSSKGALPIDVFSIPFDITPMGIRFKYDGTKMYLAGQNSQELHEFILPTPFRPSSNTTPSVFISLSVLSSAVINFVLSTDGDFIFVVDGDKVYTFPLPIPWSIISNVTNSSVTIPGIDPHAIAFKPEGDKMYIYDIITSKLFEFNLSPSFDVSTFVITPNFLQLGSVDRDVFFRSNGKELFVLRVFGDSLKYHIDKAWNMSFAFYHSNQFTPVGDTQFGISWMLDGTKFFVLGIDSGDANIQEYTTLNPWNQTNAIPGAVFSIQLIDSNVQAMWWKPDGTRCYILGINTNAVHQLNLATPWDVSTISNPSISFTPSVGEFTDGSGMYFRSDGTKFFVASQSTQEIFEYDITIPWDIVNAFFTGSSKDFSSDVNILFAPFFRPDGKLLYVIDNTNNLILRYGLSIPWKVSTAIFANESFDISAQEANPTGIFVREYDGKKLHVIGITSNTIFSYDVSLEFNNSIISNFGDELSTNLGEILVYQ